MQPDPSVFIPAMRRELLSPDLLGRSLAEGIAPIIVQRMAETLAQLTLRHTRLPQILREELAGRTALLKRIKEECPDLEPSVTSAVEYAVRVGSQPPGQSDVQAYEAWSAAISDCIRELSQRRKGSPQLATLLADVRREGSRFDLHLRTRYKQELEFLRQEIKAPQGASSIPQPTDAELTAVLRSHFPNVPGIAARDVRRLPGVNSKETFFFELMNHPQWPAGMVLRREPIFNPTRTFVADEINLVNELQRQGLPVPRALTADRQGRGIGSGFIIVERLPGAPRIAEAWGPAGRP
ncbi:MAG: phosphotransferase, partial [Steroidobacteraceae bacterium]